MSNTKRVLFVDDDASLGKMFVDLLSGAGYDARICETGAAALQQVSLFHPHVVLLDIGLPDISGLEVLRKIRNAPSTRDTPVILITGASGLDMKIEGFQTGASDYVAKPLNSRELLLKVDRCFNTLKDQAATLALKQRELLQTIMNTLGHALTSPLAAIHNEVRLSQQETQNAAWAKRMNRIEVASQQIEQSLAKLQSMIKVSTKELLPGVHLLDIEEPKQPRE